MAASSSLQQPAGSQRRGRWGSPERTVVWTEPKQKPTTLTRKVAVVYYLCHRDGHLDHPHFLEMDRAPAGGGLYLRDFTARLTALRGSGMPSLYSWSSKRSYKHGYVWQDLAEDDLIHPAHANDEYVLKGSPLLMLLPHQLPPPPPSTRHDASAPNVVVSSSHHQVIQDRRAAGRGRRKNWSSFDLGDGREDYNSNKLELVAAQAQAQQQDAADPSTELGIDAISPPPSSSSPDDEALQDRYCGREVGVIAGGRMRASAMLMQLFSCGSIATAKRPGHARRRSSDLMMSASSRKQAEEKEAADECLSGGGDVVGMGGSATIERDYFSGSLVESSKTGGGGGGGGDGAFLLKRSSSCNADRGAVKLKLPVAAKEVRAGCLASRAGRASKKNTSRFTSTTVAEAESRVDGGECKGGTVEPTAGPGGAAMQT